MSNLKCSVDVEKLLESDIKQSHSGRGVCMHDGDDARV